MARWKHDCARCEYLGQHTSSNVVHDLYYCPGTLGGSVIARFGDNGSSYMSIKFEVLLSAQFYEEFPLIEAAKRQIRRWTEDGGK